MNAISTVLFLTSSQETPTLTFDWESIFDALLKESTDCIVVKDVLGRYVWINPAGEAFLGQSLEDILGKTDWDLFDHETAQTVMDTDRAVMQQGKTQTVQAVLKPFNQEARLFQAVKCPYKGENGEVKGIISVIRHIPEQSEMLQIKG